MIDCKELYRLYVTEGKTANELSMSVFSVNRRTINKWIKKCNITPHSKNYRPKGYKKPPLTDAHKAILRKFRLGKKLPPHLKEIAIRNLKSGEGKDHASWKGGRYINAQGYVMVWARHSPYVTKKNGYIMEHRLVMSEFLQRKLDVKEHIHHINGDTQDNRIDNLMLVTPNEHQHIEWRNKPQKIKEQSDRIKRIRRIRWWSSKKRTS